MRAGLRFGIAAAVLAFGQPPALAQDTAAPPPPPSNSTDTIGPRELQNFSLNGSVTRPAPDTPEPSRPAPAAIEPGTAPPPTGNSIAPAGRAERTVAAPSEPTPRAQAPAPAPSTVTTLPPDGEAAAPASAGSRQGFTPEPPTRAPALDGSSNAMSPLPWIVVLLLLAGAATWYFRRQRAAAEPEPAFAADPAELFTAAERFAAPEPTPPPRPVAPPPPLARAPTPAIPLPPEPAAAPPPQHASPQLLGTGGIVSARLRPWIEIEFDPSRCILDEEKAVLEFDVALYNSGGGPARDVLIEGAMFNAGQDQDEEIAQFFRNPVAQGDRIPLIEPFKRVELRSGVGLSRDQLRVFEAGGRQLFVPLIGFNALYRWSGGEGQTSASFLVGREGSGDKMAPFRVDLGPRVFRGLGKREHELRVRA
jgi:hypothetical protein